jgi:hypothetical protein
VAVCVVVVWSGEGGRESGKRGWFQLIKLCSTSVSVVQWSTVMKAIFNVGGKCR